MLNGSFTIQNDNDVAAISCFTEITGDLNLDAPGVASISLPLLQVLGGGIRLTGSGAPNLLQLDLPALTYAGNGVVLHADTSNFPTSNLASLATLNVPVLAVVGVIDFNAPLAAVDLPALTTAAQGLFVYGAPSHVSAPQLSTSPNVTVDSFNGPPTNVSLPMVSKADSGVSLYGNLGTLDLSALGSAAYLWVKPNVAVSLYLPALTTLSGVGLDVDVQGPLALSMPALTAVAGDVFIAPSALPLSELNAPALATVSGRLDIEASSLTTLSLPALTSVGANVTAYDSALTIGLDPGACGGGGGNSQLTTLDLPALTTVGPNNDGGITFGENPLLSQCRAQALVTQVYNHGWFPLYALYPQYECPLASGPCP